MHGYRRTETTTLSQEVDTACLAALAACGLDDEILLAELQQLLARLGTARIGLSLYLVDLDGMSTTAAHALLRRATGSCAMLRTTATGRHLVIDLGPEPKFEDAGFPARLRRSLDEAAPAPCRRHPRARVRHLRRWSHDITTPAFLLLDLANAPPVLASRPPD
ncbi:MAG: hypothetical protein QF578_20700 [Alphaproteobacteria bacterium]|jgi:hypothetical protein|nr:hypothetical protein [Alphaproteobacteria bacterium]MDP6567261.1 hypothetical protein [Alphaproteobacteria bacterium]MDP6811691.1 hypothetical protein [Alphaproteobacteria bacterium]